MTSLVDDKLDGAAEIATFLGPQWNEQRVYNGKRRQLFPLRSLPGVGLYAFKSELEAFFKSSPAQD